MTSGRFWSDAYCACLPYDNMTNFRFWFCWNRFIEQGDSIHCWACSLLQKPAETKLLFKEHSVGSGWNIKMNWHQYKKDTRMRNTILGTQKTDSSMHNNYSFIIKHWMHVYTCHDQEHFILRKHKKEVSIKVVALQRSHFVLISKPQTP